MNRERWNQAFILVVLLALTISFRLWNLEGTFWFKTDEGNNGYLALQILREHKIILRGITSHFGAVAHYLTAGLFGLFGVNIFVLRLMPAMISIITTLVCFLWVKKLAGIRAAILCSLLLLFSSWMIFYGRISWEMSPNVLFVSLAAISTYTFIKNRKLTYAFLTGLFIGLAANGHLYIVMQALPFGLTLLLSKATWKHRVATLLLAGAGGLLALTPLTLATYQNNWDLFSNYRTSGAETAARTLHGYILRLFGTVSQLATTLGPTGFIAFIFAYAWAASIAARKSIVAIFFVVAIGIPILLLPLVVSADPPVSEGRTICRTLSSIIGNQECIPTKARYFDIIYPLPLILIAWWATRLTKKSLSAYLLLSTLIILPGIPESYQFITRVEKWRIDRLIPVIQQLPEDSCILLNAPLRDYVRMWTVAHPRQVVYASEKPPCKKPYLVSAYNEIPGPHLSLIQDVTYKKYPLWYVYEVTQQVDEVMCPDSATDKPKIKHRNWHVDSDHPSTIICKDSCKTSWQATINDQWQNIPLYAVIDCTAVGSEEWIKISADNGKTWHTTCDHDPVNRPPTRWIETGITIPAGTESVALQIQADIKNQGNPQTMKEVRLCSTIPYNIEQAINKHPLGWQ